jgi:hypothetical protein
LTGWGKHSKVAGDSTLKRAVESRLLQMRAPFHVGRHNEGRLVCAGHVVRDWLQAPRTLDLLILHDIVFPSVFPSQRTGQPETQVLSLQEIHMGDSAG